MYEAFFGLQSRPFAAGPRPERYFPASAVEAARQVLGRCIERSEGAGLLIGPAGTGKTLLLQVLAVQFRASLEIACLSSGRLTSRKELLQAILFELGLPYRGLDEGESRLSLIDHLSQTASNYQGLLLIIDEAHTLPLKLLEELRLITNLVRHGQPRVRIVLAGGPVLEERFASPKLEAFNQRLAARCYLEGFERAETMEYVRAQIRLAGGNPEQIFTADALEGVHRATDGIPRLINQVCDHGLILAFAGGCRQLGKPAIEEAWADLQQLPTPWNSAAGAPEKESAGASIIEFGSLDEEFDEGPAAVPFRQAMPEQKLSEQKSPEPKLSISPGTNDAEPRKTLPQPQPVAQLTRIEDQLATLEEDFQSLDDVSESVDVVYPPADHPFQDEFEEEEVVVDRYATLTANTFRDRPHVNSREGQELSRLLTPFALQPAGGSVAIAASTTKENTNSAEQTAPASGSSSFSTDAVTEPTQELENDRSAEVATVTDRMSPELPDDDADLIVVEELPREATLAVTNPSAAPVKRQEYRQLFAKLRRS